MLDGAQIAAWGTAAAAVLGGIGTVLTVVLRNRSSMSQRVASREERFYARVDKRLADVEQRADEAEREMDAMRAEHIEEVDALRERVHLAEQFIGQLTHLLIINRIPVPARPASLH